LKETTTTVAPPIPAFIVNFPPGSLYNPHVTEVWFVFFCLLGFVVGVGVVFFFGVVCGCLGFFCFFSWGGVFLGGFVFCWVCVLGGVFWFWGVVCVLGGVFFCWVGFFGFFFGGWCLFFFFLLGGVLGGFGCPVLAQFFSLTLSSAKLKIAKRPFPPSGHFPLLPPHPCA